MKENKQIRLFVIIAIAFIAIVALIVNLGNKSKGEKTAETNTKDNETTVITTSKMTEVKKYGGLEITNVQIKVDDSMTKVTANVLNSTQNDMDGQLVNINVLDKEGNKITSVGGYISPLKSGESTTLKSSILSNGEDTKAYDVEITEKVKHEEDNGNQDTGVSISD